MKKFEIKAFSYKEAIQKALDAGIAVVRNVTQSYKKDNPVDFDAWASNILKRNHLDVATGVGLIIVVDQGVSDTRNHPYELINGDVGGTIIKKRVFRVYTKNTERLIAEKTKKHEAIHAAKEAMKTIKEDMICIQSYVIAPPKNIAFELNYVPSVRTKEGTYIVFGN